MTYNYETVNALASRIDITWDGTHDTEYSVGSMFGWSLDGTKIVYQSNPFYLDPNSTYNGSAWYMKDVGTGTVTPISVDTTGNNYLTTTWHENANHHLDEGTPNLSPSNEGFIFATTEQLDTDGTDGNRDLFYKKFSDDSITHISPDDTVDVATSTKTVDSIGNWLTSKTGDVVVYDMDAHSGVNTGKPVYVQDLDTGSRTLINQYTNGSGHEYYYSFGNTLHNGLGSNAKLTHDNEKIYFHNTEDYDPADTNNADDIYFFDIDTQDFELVTVQSDGTKGNDDSRAGLLSPDGNKLYFLSDATNFIKYWNGASWVDRDTNGVTDIYVKDLTSGVISAVTFDEATGSTPNGYYGNQLNQDFAISPDGTQVAYLYHNYYHGASTIYVRDMTSTDFIKYEIDQQEWYLSQGSYSLAFSPDGSKLTFLTTDALESEDTNGQRDAYYIDLSFEYITGTDGCETLTGSGYDEVIQGLGHSDVIYGDSGDDILYGGEGHDTLYGESDFDTLYGGTGHDYLDGGNNDDVIRGMDGHDTIYGGHGNDTIYTGTEDDQSDTVYGGDGDDIIYVAGMGNDQIYMDGGADTLVIGGDQVRTTVHNFTDGTDLIDLTVFGSGLSMSNVSFYEGELDGWTVKVIDGANRADIHLDGLNLGSTPLTAADFIF